MSTKIKISLIGGGNIGGTLAYLLGLKEMAQEIVIYDLNKEYSKGKFLDITQAISIYKKDISIKVAEDYSEIADSNIIVITAGIARQPNMSRDDLTQTNIQVMKSASEAIVKYSPKAFVIVVTNPIDVMVYAVYKYTSLPSSHVVGMGGVLDTGRFKTFLSDTLKVSTEDIQALILGGHGDYMVPLLRYCTISGIPIKEFIEMGQITQENLDTIVKRTVNGGGEIVSLLKKGSAYHGPANSILEMIESYLQNKRKILSCSSYLDGEYGFKNIYFGVPIILSSEGVEKIIELKLTQEERELLGVSVAKIRDVIKQAKI